MNVRPQRYFRHAAACLGLLLMASVKPALAARHHHARHHGGGGLATTFYDNDGIAANGHTYSENTRLYGVTCASNRYRLGTVLQLPSRSGGFVRAVVCDRIGHGSDIDLNVRGARAIMGRHYRGIGRVSVRPTVVGHVNCLASRRRRAESGHLARRHHHRR
ncbi:MAG: hypothetical protein JO250_00715 [Armatimonadetes bacterium]|nr:hypothetical protein [Armatimonadota bacterium]